MKVIVDDKIPYIREAILSVVDEVEFVAGSKFTPEVVRDADALIVRTRTHCNEHLLKDSKVQFIATATIGYDHIDVEYCEKAGVKWCNAPGCNSSSVAQYIETALIAWSKDRRVNLESMTIGVVGVGNVGKKVASVAERLGMKVLLNDPPRAEKEGMEGFCSIDDIKERCDVITFHTPLVRSGKYNTFHLADDDFFTELSRSPLVINTSRGEVVCTSSIKKALETGRICDAVIDVWENEPEIDIELMNKAFIATPHIAGYSADGKANATRMSLESMCKHFGIDAEFDIQAPLPENRVVRADDLLEAKLNMYNPLYDSEKLKNEPQKFEWFRGNYPLRREEIAYEIVLTK